METRNDLQILAFTTQKDWEEWLARHHQTTKGLWLKIAKKAGTIPTISYDEALEGALCFGWIDGLVNAFDNNFYLQKFTPRGPKSTWSKRNRELVTRLIQEKKMHPAGLEKINAAKKDGKWDIAYDSPANMKIPDDFLQALAKDKKAETFFKSLNKANTYAIAWRLQTAKKPETREKRMQTILAMLAKGEKLH